MRSSKPRSKIRLPKSEGFTIIETMIALVIVGIVLLVVFVAIPALQRNARNARRERDAALVAAAVNECLANNYNNYNACRTPESLPIDYDRLGIFTGVLYGGDNLDGEIVRVPPTIDEPNWLFALRCTENQRWILETEVRRSFVVTYLLESADGTVNSRCIDG